jgi:hypothetical protein
MASTFDLAPSGTTATHGAVDGKFTDLLNPANQAANIFTAMAPTVIWGALLWVCGTKYRTGTFGF